MQVTLRPALPPDENFIRGLVRDTIAIELNAAAWPEPIRNQLLEMQTNIRYVAGTSSGESFVIEADGNPAGWILLMPVESELRLVEIMIRPEVRGHGIGSAAIREVIDSGGRPVVLTVNATNSGAIRLYQRLGFQISAVGEVQHVMRHESSMPTDGLDRHQTSGIANSFRRAETTS